MKKQKGRRLLKINMISLLIVASLVNLTAVPGGRVSAAEDALTAAGFAADGTASVPDAIAAVGGSTHLRNPEELGLDEELMQWLEDAGEALTDLAAERDIMALVYLTDSYEVKAEAGFDSDTVLTVLSGQQVNLLDFCFDEEYELWYYVRLNYNAKDYYGYVQRAYLACSDARFLNWEEEYGMGIGRTYALEDGYADIEQFPESYQEPLTALKEQHPNWTFVKMNTGLDWNYVIQEEMKGGKSLVYYTFPDWAKNGLYDRGTWYYATEDVLKIYMDPRNGLTEDRIFQFEQLTYNEEYHTLEAIEQFLQNTFMGGNTPAPGMDNMPFSYMFWAIGKEECRQVSPFHLAARVLQEQGSRGGSRLISGVEPGFEGYYNYFNIGATGQSNDEVVLNGLTYAKDHWKQGAYYSILYGANFLTESYIRKGQDTLYLQKYNVNPNGAYNVFTHQYMQNISAPTTEGTSIKRLYANAGALDCTFVFKIPVYENMPAEPCKEPSPTQTIDIPYEAGFAVKAGDTGLTFPLEPVPGSADGHFQQSSFFYTDAATGDTVGSEALEGGRDYVFHVTFTAEDGYAFPENFTVIINGQTLTDGITVSGDGSVLTITYPFTTDVFPEEEAVRDFVTRMYGQCLSREPDEAGLAGWTEQLMTAQMNGAQIAEVFVFSDEMLQKNLFDEEFVRVLYRAMLGREADEAGLAGWSTELANEYSTRSEVTKAFVESAEFTAICESYGILRGEYRAVGSIERFVSRFYTECLGRPADQAGHRGWVKQLQHGYVNGAQIAESFFFSEEFVNKKVSDEGYVETLYRTILGREADEAGLAGWAEQLQNGWMTRWDILKALIESHEFAGLCETYGIERGSL